VTGPVLHIIAGCAARKAVHPDPRLCLRSVTLKRVENRAAEWVARLAAAKKTHRAIDLYQGEYWRIVKEVAERAGFLWVASAGYGLIPSDRRIASYSATFASGELDSVVPRGSVYTPQDWWTLLRSFSARTPQIERDDVVVVIASAPYIDAASADLLELRRRLSRREQFIVFTSFIGQGDSEWLNEHRVGLPVHARLGLGGTAGTISARGAAAYVRDGLIGLSATDVERTLREKYAGATIAQLRRRPGADSAISAWIKKQLRSTALSCSAALRLYRDSGYACEQSRFSFLYKSVAADLARNELR
jgi:hypothetical protein